MGDTSPELREPSSALLHLTNGRSTHTDRSAEGKSQTPPLPCPLYVIQVNMTVQHVEVIMGCLCIMVAALDTAILLLHIHNTPMHTQKSC